MKNTKLLITILILISVIGMLATIVHGSHKNKSPQTTATISSSPIPSQNVVNILFYGETCPHCQDVEAWLTKNNVSESMVTKKEVYNDQNNAQELAKVAKQCGYPTDSIGVPFLYTKDSTCLIGTPEIINYLSSTLEISTATNATETK